MSAVHRVPVGLVGTTLIILCLAAVPVSAQVEEAGPVIREMGAIDGPPSRLFDRVRSVFPVGGDRLVVADGGTHQIRLYGSGPDPVWVFGREGEGPGEFAELTWVEPYRADSLVAWDARLSRLTVIGPDGERGRTIPLGAATGVATAGSDFRSTAASRLLATGVADDGHFVARRGDLAIGPGDTTAVRRDPFAYLLLDEQGTPLREIVRLPDDETFVWATESSRAARPRAFGRTTAVEVRGDRFAFAQNDGFAVRELDLSGTRPARTVREEREPAPVTPAHRKAWRDRNAPSDRLPDWARASAQAQIDEMRFPEALPPHGDLVLGPEGAVWLEEYRAGPGAEVVWTRFSPGGDSRRIRFPPGFQLHAVDGSRAYGVTVGEFDVQYVTVLRLPELG